MWQYLAHVTARFLRKRASFLVLLALLSLLLLMFRDPVGRFLMPSDGLHSALESFDSRTFSNSQSGEYQIVRGLPDRTALVNEADLVKSIRQSRQSFDVFALTGSAFYNSQEAISDALRHGVKFRILLLDHSQKNRANLEMYFSQCGSKNVGIDWSITNARQSHAALLRLHEDAKRNDRGSIEVRWWRGIFLNSFWVRDSEDSGSSLAHVELTYYGDSFLNPSVRFGGIGQKMTTSLQQQFDYIWNKGLTTEAAEMQ